MPSMMYRLNMPLPRMLHGLEPDKLDGNTLYIRAGSCADATGNWAMTHTHETAVVIPHGMRTTPGDTFVFACGNTRPEYMTDGKRPCGFVLSRSRVYPPTYDELTIYPEWIRTSDVWRKLPASFTTPIPDFHYGTHFYRLTSPPRLGVGASASPSFKSFVSLAPYVPDNARLVNVMVETVYQGGAAGSVYVSSPGVAGELRTGKATPYDECVTQFPLRVDSQRRLHYRTTGNALMVLYVLGYWITEPV